MQLSLTTEKNLNLIFMFDLLAFLSLVRSTAHSSCITVTL